MLVDVLLVTTGTGLYLVQGRQARRLVPGDYYGLTWDRDLVYLADRNQSQILAWDGVGDPEPIPGPQLPAWPAYVHQILAWDGALYATNTGADTIERLNGESWSTVWRAPGPGDGREHVNSIWCDGYRFWLVEHRLFAEPARVRAYLPDAGGQFVLVDSHEIYGLVRPQHAGLHNAYVEDGQFFTLKPDRLLQCDTGGGAMYGMAHELGGGYLRGLARTPGRWYVGQSKAAERAHRAEGDRGVLVLDDKFDLLAYLPIPGAGGVYDVRALQGDQAHNGLACPIPLELAPVADLDIGEVPARVATDTGPGRCERCARPLGPGCAKPWNLAPDRLAYLCDDCADRRVFLVRSVMPADSSPAAYGRAGTGSKSSGLGWGGPRFTPSPQIKEV